MSDELKRDKATPIRAWGVGGPLSPAQRKEAKALFLEELKRVQAVSLACDYAGIDRSTVYRWKDKDQKFAADWQDCVEHGHDVARSSIYTRGILGWDEKVASQGQVVMEYEPVVDEEGNQRFDEKHRPLFKGGKPLTIHKWSDSLAALYAKANLPEYKDKPQVNINAQLEDLAEQDKQALLADLDAAIAHEHKKPKQEKEL